MKSSGFIIVLSISLVLTLNINHSNGEQISDKIKIEFIQNVKENLMETFESPNDYDRLQRELLKPRNQECYENLQQLMNAKNKDKYFEFESLLFLMNKQNNRGKELVQLFNNTVYKFFSTRMFFNSFSLVFFKCLESKYVYDNFFLTNLNKSQNTDNLLQLFLSQMNNEGCNLCSNNQSIVKEKRLKGSNNKYLFR